MFFDLPQTPPVSAPTPPPACANIGDTHKIVQDYYGKQLKSTKDLKFSACCSNIRPPPLINDIWRMIPNEVNERFYGCGVAVPLGIENMNVLDLGCGSGTAVVRATVTSACCVHWVTDCYAGRDCYTSSALVGEHGRVIGVDMTDEQLAVARAHVDEFTKTLGYARPNMTFLKGCIEDLTAAGVKPDSVDLAISNCVVNLSPDKKSVLASVFASLKEGGEFYFGKYPLLTPNVP